ncbi:hypothetical protein ACVWZ6_002791 [Bradyrhizobium sp. GM6.1]
MSIFSTPAAGRGWPLNSCRTMNSQRSIGMWARPALVANKIRAMQLQAGHPQQKGSRRGPAYAYYIKALRDREMLIVAKAERSYERFVSPWKAGRPEPGAQAPQSDRTK